MWLRVFFALIKLALAVLDVLEKRKQVEQEKARLLRENLEVADELAQGALAARRSVDHSPDSVRDDPFNRDRKPKQDGT